MTGEPLRLHGLAERLTARYPLLAVLAADLHDGEAQVRLAAAAAGRELRDADSAAAALALLEQQLATATPAVVLLRASEAMVADSALVQRVQVALPAAERAGVSLVLLASHLPEVPSWSRDLVRLVLPLPSCSDLATLVAAALEHLDLPQQAIAVRALQGLTLAQARRALRRVRALDATEAIGQLRNEKRDLLASSGVVEVVAAVPAATEIGGLDALQGWLQRQARALEPAARDFGVPLPRGVLLVGVQGCGKTLSAKAAAAVLGMPLLRLDIGRLHGGQRTPDENLRLALQVAEAMAPVVLWIDEIDKAFGGVGGNEDSARVFGSLLTWLGEGRHGVFVTATANRLTHLPAELLRKGRFDETFFVDIPDQTGRAAIVALALRSSGRDPAAFDLERLVRASDRLTGAEITTAVAEALQQAYCGGHALTDSGIEAVLSKVVPFVETYDLQVRELRQWAKRHCRPASRDRSLHELFAAAKETR
jgi:hypothetical protein